jgi:hydrogenase maturation protease
VRSKPAARALVGVLVIACGNPLRGDDAAGPEVGDALATLLEGTGATVIVTHQLLPELADDVSRAHRIVFVDAAAGRPAGSVSVSPLAAPQLVSGERSRHTPGGDLEEGRALVPFSHGMGPADVLALARDLYSATPEALLVSVGAAGFEPGAALSPAVRRALPDAVHAAHLAILAGASAGNGSDA